MLFLVWGVGNSPIHVLKENRDTYYRYGVVYEPQRTVVKKALNQK